MWSATFLCHSRVGNPIALQMLLDSKLHLTPSLMLAGVDGHRFTWGSSKAVGSTPFLTLLELFLFSPQPSPLAHIILFFVAVSTMAALAVSFVLRKGHQINIFWAIWPQRVSALPLGLLQ